MSVSAALTEANTYTDWISPKKLNLYGADFLGRLTLSLYGTWVGVITIQRRFYEDGEYTDPLDVDIYTSNTEKNIEDPDSRVQYRAGFKVGDYSSGTANIRIGD